MITHPTVWIVGTSVSIEEGGYVTQLRKWLSAAQTQIRNLSVGDQTSLMGYMRVLTHREEIRPGDLVVWEYGLLDTLLTAPVDNVFPAADVHAARRLAWKCILERSADVFILLTPPRSLLAQRSECESMILDDARQLGLAALDARDAFDALEITDAHAHYRDDRHPRIDSPVIDVVARSIVEHLKVTTCVSPARLAAWVRALALPAWHWRSSRELAYGNTSRLQVFANALTSVEALMLAPGQRIAVLTGGWQRLRETLRRRSRKLVWSGWRTIAIGIVSTHDSGCLWCGHVDCAATSTTLPADLAYTFLLRTTRSSCHHGLAQFSASADAKLAQQCWSDYGQARPSSTTAVAVTGILFTRSDVAQLEPLRA